MLMFKLRKMHSIHKRLLRLQVCSAFLAAPLLIAAETPGLVVNIATDTVDSNDNKTSLREAIAYANDKPGADTITFSNGENGTVNFHDDQAETITLGGTELLVYTEMRILGPGAGKLAISGNQKSRIFQFGGEYSVKSISGLSIRNGRTSASIGYDNGGGILLYGGELTLDGCVLSGNTAVWSGGGIYVTSGSKLTLLRSSVSGNTAKYGGGIFTSANDASAPVTLTLVQCTVSGNSASYSDGGGIHSFGGGVARGNKFTMVQCTVSENTAERTGAGIITGGAAVNITQCTVSGNIARGREPGGATSTAPIAGGVFASNCTLDLENCILANSTGKDFHQAAVTLNLKGRNLIEDASIPAGPNVINSDPLLGPLQNNGGPTFTHALLPGSKAINAVTNTSIPSDTFDIDGDLDQTEPLPFDQRGTGYPRATEALDIGALEQQKSVWIAADATSRAEGTGAGKTAFHFTVSRMISTSGDVTVDYAVNGAAVNGADFDGSLPNGTVTIPDGKDSTTLSIEVGQDGTPEPNEAFTVTLGNPGNGYVVFGPGAVSTIDDDDTSYVSISATDSSADENTAGTGVWRINRSGSLAATRLQLAIISSSSAMAADWSQTGADFASRDPGGTGTVDIPAGATFVDVTLTPINDIHAEATETVQLGIVANAAYVITGTAAATITVGQNDFVVINTNNTGEGSLRQAMLNSNNLAGAETITFEGGVFNDSAVPDTILLSSSLPSITGETAIAGPGSGRLVIRRPAETAGSALMLIVAGSNVTLSGLTLSGGAGGIGNAGSLRVDRCTISDSQSSHYGGILNNGTLTVSFSTISGNNSSSGLGGGIYNFADRPLSVFNSTISGNSSKNGGGGLFLMGGSLALIANSTISGNTTDGPGAGVRNDGFLTVSNSTISGNRGNGPGGGISTISLGKLTLANSIVAGNSASTGPDINTSGPTDLISSNGANFIGDATGAAGSTSTDKTFASTGTTLSQLLAPLSDNGGPTLTHALVSGSPAINAGANSDIPTDTIDLDGDSNITELLPYDQRGAGFLRGNGDKVDIGSWESFQFEPTIAAATTDEDVKSSADLVITANPGDGGLTTHYKITGIRNGTLYQNDGVTVIAPDSFITRSQGAAGLKFLPEADLNSLNTAEFGFTAQVATGATDADLRGAVVTARITVRPVNDAPTVIAPGLADQSLTLGESRVVFLPPCFTDIDSAPLTYTVVGNSSRAIVSAVISGKHLTLRGLDNGVARITVVASDGLGGTVPDSFQISVGSSVPTLIQPVTKNIKVNPGNGLFDVVVKVTNTTPFPINGFRLHVDYGAYKADYPTLRLENADSPRNRDVAFVDYRNPVAVDGSVTLTLSFYTRDRKFPKRFKPVYTVESFKPAATRVAFAANTGNLRIAPASTSALTEIPATDRAPRATLMPDRTVRLEFPSTPGHWYRVSYSSDLIRWVESPDPIQAGSSTLLWTDGGPPGTATHPAGEPSRFYRIHEVTPP